MMSSRSGPHGPVRSQAGLPAWVVASAIVVVLAGLTVAAIRLLFPPPLRVEAEKGSEGARWAELMKRTGGQGPVGTRPYAGDGGAQTDQPPRGH